MRPLTMITGILFGSCVAISISLMLVLVVWFHSLTVVVTAEEVRIRFGSGPIRKSFPVPAIRDSRPVRNHWYNGWGIRWIPGGWLFNVSGLSAVELTLDRSEKRA